MSYANYEDMPMFLTVKEISDLLGLSTAGVYNLANNDKSFDKIINVFLMVTHEITETPRNQSSEFFVYRVLVFMNAERNNHILFK